MYKDYKDHQIETICSLIGALAALLEYHDEHYSRQMKYEAQMALAAATGFEGDPWDLDVAALVDINTKVLRGIR